MANPTIGMFVGDEEIERRQHRRRLLCEHGLPISDPCDECNAFAEAELDLARVQTEAHNHHHE